MGLFMQLNLNLIPSFLSFSSIIFESVRWLLSQKQYGKAEKILQKIAKFNGLEAPTKFLQAYGENEELVQQMSSKEPGDQDLNTLYSKLKESPDKEQQQQQTKLTVLDLFKSRNLAKNTILLSLDW